MTRLNANNRMRNVKGSHIEIFKSDDQEINGVASVVERGPLGKGVLITFWGYTDWSADGL